MPPHARRPLDAFVVMVLLLGCSGSTRPETAPVSGTLTYRGQPVAGAKVAFMQDGAPRSASGETDEAGHFELTTFEPGDGAILGTHVVTIYKPKIDVAITGPEPGVSRDEYLAAMDKAAAKAMEAQEAGSALPAKYADPATSGLTREVNADDNEIDIELVD